MHAVESGPESLLWMALQTHCLHESLQDGPGHLCRDPDRAINTSPLTISTWKNPLNEIFLCQKTDGKMLSKVIVTRSFSFPFFFLGNDIRRMYNSGKI